MDLGYRGLISDFMKEIGKGNHIVVAISDKYLKSQYCMFEMFEIYRNCRFDRKEAQKKIYPIRLEALELVKPSIIGEYLDYWKNKKQEWDAHMKEKTDQLNLSSMEIYNRIKDIYLKADDLINLLADMNSLNIGLLSKQNFLEIKNAIRKMMQNDNNGPAYH